MKKIIVIGCPGSGKSTVSRVLHNRTGIPLYHLDMMFWNADKTTVERGVFLERLSAVMSLDEWIVDGNYGSTMELRLQACDAVFFLDYPLSVCLRGIEERRGMARSDMPWTETDEDKGFVDYVKSFNEKERPKILELLEKHRDKDITVFHSREEAEVYLNGEKYDFANKTRHFASLERG